MDNEFHSLQSPQAPNQRASIFSGPMSSPQIVEDSENLAIVPKNSTDQIVEVNEFGVTKTIDLKVPAGYTLGLMISSGERIWKFTSYVGMRKEKVTADGYSSEIAVKTPGPILEFDPLDGSLTRKIATTNEFRAHPVCSAREEFRFFTASAKDGVLEELTATVPH